MAILLKISIISVFVHIITLFRIKWYCGSLNPLDKLQMYAGDFEIPTKMIIYAVIFALSGIVFAISFISYIVTL